ncbi:peptidase M24, structural domain-containing protein [Lipomyces arxii]|uniref:peptidase M24, structural domain-containing protein n=1 Tax=Lipomyces arxii TaxID=56418 RepID=UPI0034CE1136
MAGSQSGFRQCFRLVQRSGVSRWFISQNNKIFPGSVLRTPITTRCCRPYATQTGFGQPTHETRPHLLKEGELTPGIQAVEYHLRRRALADKMQDGAVAIFVGAEKTFRSGVVFHEFHQNPNVYYLSGFMEPNCVIAIERHQDDYEFHMFVEPKNERVELWEGPRTGVQGALDVFNADSASDIGGLRKRLDEIIGRASVVYMDKPKDSSDFGSFFSPQAKRGSPEASIIEMLKHYGKYKNLKALSPIMHRLRSVKSPAELQVMMTAGQISGRAFTEAYAERFTKEADLYAFLEYVFKIGGCEKSAYVPVVAGGTHSLAIHYTRNDDVLHPGDMVLVDAGGQYGGYCADISRTWPVNGKFTDAQKDLYQCVLNVQKACIELANTSNSLQSLQQEACRLFQIELKNIGFDASMSDITNILYPHYIGHHVGIDLHDCSLVPRNENLNNGNVVTIEPGIYVPVDNEKFPKHFRGMGIRIEDNVYINDNSPLITCAAASKEVDDIERVASGLLE